MKNTIIVLTVLLLGTPVFAQNDSVFNYTEVNRFLQSEKNKHGLLLQANNKHLNYNRFIELFNHLLHPVKKSTDRPVTFMSGPVVFSAALPVEISRNTNTLYQRYSASITEPSAALQILGLAAGITAGALSHNRYTGISDPYYYNVNSRYLDGSPRYLDSRAAIEGSYLQSTWFQHDK